MADKLSSNCMVQITDLHKSYGVTKILDGISLDVARGTVTCIIGPSGSGKSTLIRCVNGLADVQRGSVKVKGIEVNDKNLDKLALRQTVGMVFQQYNLFPHKSVLENVVMAPVHVLKEDRKLVTERAHSLLAKVGLAGKENSYPDQLSGGQQQRVAIARSLAMRPEVMLFDEVTSALDPEMVKEVLITIRELAEEGMTCMLVTHEMNFAREIGNEIIFIDRGKIVEQGEPRDFFSNPRDQRTRQFLDKVL